MSTVLSSWYGNLPPGWQVCRVGDVATIVNGFPFDSAGFSKTGTRRLIRIRDLLADDDQVFFDGEAPASVIVRDDDVLVGMDGDFNVAWWDRGEALLNQRLCCVRPRCRIEARFLYYALPIPLRIVNDLTYFTTVKHLSSSQVAAIRLPLPSVGDQRTIADFLDRKTAALDALIAKKERLVEVLDEKRRAAVNHIVLRGLDGGATLRPTGTVLGDIPSYWSITRLMHLTPVDRPIMYGIVLPGPNVDDGVPIVKSGNCVPEKLRLSDLHRTTRDIEARYERSRLRADDIVYAIRGSVGMAALVPPEVAGANLTQDAARIAPAPGVSPRWLLYAVQSHAVWSQLQAGVVGATVKGINIRDLKRPWVPLPPAAEQVAIADHLDALVARDMALIAKTTASIEKLREFRQALITAAVTGQLDLAAYTQEAA